MPRHLSFFIGLLSMVFVFSPLACGTSSPDRSDRGSPPVAGRKDTFLAFSPEDFHSSKPSEKLFVPLTPLGSATRDNEQYQAEEMPVWLAEALDDPDPGVRLQAIETWANNPEETLNPLTYALVDPDESVRLRAQELLEEELTRR